jgi:uncharacterized protein YdaU (DUF1376 family)
VSAHAKLPFDTEAYLADTKHLSTTEHGAYMLLLIAMWRSPDGYLPNDDRYLANASRLTLDKWRKISGTIRTLLRTDGKRVTQKRIQKEQRLNPPCQDSRQDSRQDVGMASKSLETNSPILENTKTTKNDEASSLFSSSLDSESKKKVKREPRAGLRITLPENWKLSEKGRAYAMERGFGHGRIDKMATKFFNYHRGKGSKMADWEAAWRMWVENEIEYSNRDGGSNGTGFHGRGRSASDAADRLVDGLRTGELSIPPRPTLLWRESETPDRLLPQE